MAGQYFVEFTRFVSGELARAILLSLLPGAFWLWYVVRSAPERPRWLLLAIALLAGGCSPALVLGLGWVVEQARPEWAVIPATAAGQLLFFVGGVGLVEEFAKLLAVRLTVYRSSDFREPWDGLMYSSASALGFATVENVKYVVGFGDPSVLLGRSLLSTFGHVLMSACWGYALGVQKAGPGQRWITLQGLLVAALGHGVFDFWLLRGQSWLAVAVLGGLFALYRTRLTDSVLQSDRRQRLARVVWECPLCRALVREGCQFCTTCGQPLAQGLSRHCGLCLSRWERPGPCPQCGALAR